MVSNHALMRLGKLKPTRIWIWWDIWKAIKKDLYKYICSKRKTGENTNPLLNRAGKLLTRDTEKDMIISTFLASVFTSTTRLQAHETVESWEEGILTLSGGSCWGIFKLHRRKSMEPEKVAPTSAEGADGYQCKATLGCLWRVMGNRGGFWGVRGSKYHPS